MMQYLVTAMQQQYMYQLYAGTTSIPYTNVTPIFYQALSKKDTTWKNDIYHISVLPLQDFLKLFLDKCDDFVNKTKGFYNPLIRKFFNNNQ